MSDTLENNRDDYATYGMSHANNDLTVHELTPQHFHHRDPGYRPWLRPPGPRKPTPYEEILALMATNLNYAVFSSRCVFVFSLIIALDFVLPNTSDSVEVTGYNVSTSGTIQMELNDGSVVNISKKAMRKMKSKALTISRTRLFQVPYKMTDKENNEAKFEISIYGNFIFMPLVLLITSLVGILYRKGVEFRFNLGVASLVLAILNIIFFHVHKF
jgi:hypothetical protein